jgi:16S rRNA (guanine527-N7)-methyltransferase
VTKLNQQEAVQIFWRIDEWFPELSLETRQKLKKYHEELLKFNNAVNLIGVKTIPMADAIHFADSILACKVITQSATIEHVYDFGSGNGFPGLVMAIMNPKIKVSTVDTDQRKSEFIKHVANILGLKNIEVLVRPVEALPEGSIQHAISRGFAPIAKALLLSRKLMKPGGVYFHLKSEEWATEIAQIPTQLCTYWMPALLSEYKLPIGEIKFAVVRTEKLASHS